MTKKYAEIVAAKQKAAEWEASTERQAQLAKEAKRSEEAAAVFPGGPGRRKLLLAALASQGLRLRLDSQLCNAYIRANVGTVDAIADTMAGIEWLFDNTDYPSRCPQVSVSKALWS